MGAGIRVAKTSVFRMPLEDEKWAAHSRKTTHFVFLRKIASWGLAFLEEADNTRIGYARVSKVDGHIAGIRGQSQHHPSHPKVKGPRNGRLSSSLPCGLFEPASKILVPVIVNPVII